MTYETTVTLHKREYKIVITDGTWRTYKQDKWGGWQKMSLWTRAEERNFPKALGILAHELVKARSTV